MNIYDDKFYKSQCDLSLLSAKKIVPVVCEMLHPKNVIDVGCGIGTWLSVFFENGCDVTGIDGDYVNRKSLLIKKEQFTPFNLEKRINSNKKYDLAISLEVAEHLPESRAISFVEDLTHLSDTILFSAAIIGQEGTNHVNCQMQQYWADLFQKFNYSAVDCIRPIFWNADTSEIASHYINNTILYVKQAHLHDLNLSETKSSLNIIHPSVYLEYVKRYNKLAGFYPIKIMLRLKRKIKKTR